MQMFGWLSGSFVALSWFCAISLLLLGGVTYFGSSSLHRKHRMFHWLICVLAAMSGILYLMLATTGFGSSMIGDMQMYWAIPLILGLGVPLMLGTLALFAGCSLIEARALSICATLQYVCWVFMYFHSMENSLFESRNRWVWWVVQLAIWVPIGQALLNGLKIPAMFDSAQSHKVGRLCSLMLLYYIIQQVFLLFTHGFRLIHPATEAMGLVITNFLVIMIFSVSMVNDSDVIERTIDSNAGLQLLSGAYEDTGMEGETTGLTHRHFGPSAGSGVEGSSKVYQSEVTVLKPSWSPMTVKDKSTKGPQQV